MPLYSHDLGPSKSPCLHPKKTVYNNGGSQCHIIPITKRPIDKVTTRSQAQYQQLIKQTMGKQPEALIDNCRPDWNNNQYAGDSFLTNRNATTAVATVTKTTNQTIATTNLNNGTAKNLKKGTSSQAKSKAPNTMTISTATKPNAQSSTSASDWVDQTLDSTLRYVPFAPQKVLQHPEFSKHLTNYEKKEILNHSKIYFIGKKGIKKLTPHTSTTTSYGADGFDIKIFGFDDNNGSYVPVLHDHIAYRYEVLKVIGKGTFGIVLQAYDHKNHNSVALKIIRNQARFHTQAKEEIRILTKLLENDADNKFNVVHMYENFMFRNHPCIVFELLSLNLFELSKKNSYGGFNLALIRRFTFALVKCLYALSKFDIIHCDLKPENILLKQQNRSGIKVIDFGSSCFSNKRVHTYIQSRYYRSPEVILCGKYGPAIDMWSLGCILAELYLGRPLLDGENEGDQLACMMELLNVPPYSFLSKCKSSKVRQFFDTLGNPICWARYHQGQYRTEPVRSPRGKIRGEPGTRNLLSNCEDYEFVDFVSRCLVWDPADRMTPSAALKHPWLNKRTSQVETYIGNNNEMN
jgi:dual specificity tyrosine-phosphorylation-regulated kinase 2/3/4